MKHPVLHMWSALAFVIATALAAVMIEKALAAGWTEVTAAWVQAVGSVAAIMAAVAIQVAQHRANLARDHRALSDLEQQHVNAALIAARAAVTLIEISYEQVADPVKHSHLVFFGVDEDEFQTALARIDDLKPSSFRNAQNPIKLALLRRLLKGCRDRLRLIVRAGAEGNNPSDEIKADFMLRLDRARAVEAAIQNDSPLKAERWNAPNN